MTKRLFLLLVPLALVLGVVTTALLLGAKTGTSKGNYWIYFCRIGVGAAAGRDGVKTVGPVELGKVMSPTCWGRLLAKCNRELVGATPAK